MSNTPSKFLTVAAVLCSASLFVGCSATEGLLGGDGKPEEEPTNEVQTEPEEPTFDTGPYRAEPHSGWPEEARENVGPIVETTLIGQNTLLPYEIDELFAKGRAPQREESFKVFKIGFADQIKDDLDQLEPTYLTGYTQMAQTKEKDRRAENSVYRFVSPDAAKDAAKVIHEAWLAEGGTNYGDDSTYGLEEVEVPGPEGILATKDTEQQVLHVLYPKDEFLYVLYLTNEIFDENFERKEFADDSLDWAFEYAGEYVEKQAPLIDALPTHKTPEGFGKTDDWYEVDPDDILRFTVFAPEGVQRVGAVPSTMNARMAASIYHETPEVLRMFDNAQVEAAAVTETVLFRASNSSHADLIQATFRAIDSNIEDAPAPQPYDEPQGIPGTECYSQARGKDTLRFCYLRYENYFAHANVMEYARNDDAVTTDEQQEEDPEQKLSQIIAAQYEILKHAPTK